MDTCRRRAVAVLAALLLPALGLAQVDPADEELEQEQDEPAPAPAPGPRVVTGRGVAGTEPYRALPAYAEPGEHVFLVCETPRFLTFWYEAFRVRGTPPDRDERFTIREKERGYIKAFRVQSPRDDRGAGAPRREVTLAQPLFHELRFKHAVLKYDRMQALLGSGPGQAAAHKASDPQYALVARAFGLSDRKDVALLDRDFEAATALMAPRGRVTITWTPGARTADLRLELLLHPQDAAPAVESGRCVASDPEHLGEAVREAAGTGTAQDALFSNLFGFAAAAGECEKAAGADAARRKACAAQLARQQAKLMKDYREMVGE